MKHLDLFNSNELVLLGHICEGYLAWTLYLTDICMLVTWEMDNVDVENCVNQHYDLMLKTEKSKRDYAKMWWSMANDLWTLQQKILGTY